MTSVREAQVQMTKPKRSMLPAGDSARSGVGDPDGNPWKFGTLLASAKWSQPRRVEEIAGKEINLRSAYKGGTSANWVSTVPADVTVVAGELGATPLRSDYPPDA